MMTKVLATGKNWLQERASGTSSEQFFSCLYYYYVITRFRVQFGIIWTREVFQKAEIALVEATCAIHLYKLKNSLVQIYSKLNSKPYDYLY